MGDNTAKVHISLVDGVLQIEGSEAFVSEQLSRLEPHIVRAFEHSGTNRQGMQKNTNEKNEKPDGTKGLDSFNNLFAESNGKIQILKTLPGSSNAQKTVSAALLLAYANQLQGTHSVSSDTVRELCKSHACLDSGNFMKSLKNEKALFLLEGTGKAKDIKLTVPGRSKAEELAKQLNVP